MTTPARRAKPPTAPAVDWYLRAVGMERAFKELKEAIEREGYEVILDAHSGTFSVQRKPS